MRQLYVDSAVSRARDGDTCTALAEPLTTQNAQHGSTVEQLAAACLCLSDVSVSLLHGLNMAALVNQLSNLRIAPVRSSLQNS